MSYIDILALEVDQVRRRESWKMGKFKGSAPPARSILQSVRPALPRALRGPPALSGVFAARQTGAALAEIERAGGALPTRARKAAAVPVRCARTLPALARAVPGSPRASSG
jgi:hypothetical protein